LQHVVDGRPDALRGVGGDAQAEGHLVGAQEADAVDVGGQPVGVFLDEFDGGVAVGLVNLDGKQGADVVRLQEHHHVPDFLVLLPGLGNHLEFELRNAFHLDEPFHVVLEHVEGVFAEVLDDAGGGYGPHALDEARTQVLFEGVGRGGFAFHHLGGLELFAVLRGGGPTRRKSPSWPPQILSTGAPPRPPRRRAGRRATL
jgi:hypothetical protein